MITYRPPEIDNSELLDNIIDKMHSGAKKSELNSAKEKIKDDYNNYLNNVRQLEQIVPDNRLSALCKNYLSEEYDSNPEDIKKAKKRIKGVLPSLLQAKCPYCLISEHYTFDHYLSRKYYPEFSLFSYNLIPTCGRCNNLKGEKFLDSNGDRAFINFLYDDLPDIPFLEFDIKIGEDVIFLNNINLKLDLGIPSHKIIFNHFEKLDLINRYQAQFQTYISDIIDTYGNSPLGKHFVKKCMEKRLKKMEEKYGVNYYKSAILRACLNNKEVLKYLCNSTWSKRFKKKSVV